MRHSQPRLRGFLYHWWFSRMRRKISTRLDLNAAQKQQFDELLDSMRDVHANRPRYRSLPITELFKTDGFNRDKWKYFVSSKLDTIQVEVRNVADRLANFYEGLDREQQLKAIAILDRRYRCRHR